MKKLLIFCAIGLSASFPTQASVVDLVGQSPVVHQEPIRPSGKKETPTLLDLCAAEATSNTTQHTTSSINTSLRRNHRADLIYFAIGALSTLTLLFTIPIALLRRSKARARQLAPDSQENINKIVHRTLHRFGQKVFGRNLISTTQKYVLLQSKCERQWMITSPLREMTGRKAWLITINHTGTHFEIHHNEKRKNALQSANLSASALYDALLEAQTQGPFILSRPPHGIWKDISLR